MSTTRSVQEVFQTVIDSGLYGFRGETFMCHALYQARYFKVITGEEYNQNLEAIQEYLQTTCKCVSLKDVLKSNKLDGTFQQCLWIYQNWDKRPKLDYLFRLGK